MSKQTGLIRLDGKIGGISFYRSGGKDLARIASGPSKEKIQTDPSFARTRENNVEFGGSAYAAKSLRLAFSTSMQTMADNRFTSRLTAKFREICNRSTATRGQRPITISTNRTQLENLEFNKFISFSSVFSAPFTSTNNAGRTQGTITVTNFLPASFISPPSGATHFRMLCAIGVVSDFVYNTATGTYEASDPTLNTLSGITYGAVTALNVTAPVTFTMAASLPGTPTMTATTSVIQCIGIEFFQRVGTTDYILSQGNCMKAVKLF